MYHLFPGAPVVHFIRKSGFEVWLDLNFLSVPTTSYCEKKKNKLSTTFSYCTVCGTQNMQTSKRVLGVVSIQEWYIFERVAFDQENGIQ